MNTRQHGFTLWELLMTLLVAGVLFGIGVPNVLEFQRNGAMTAAANNIVTGVLMARNEAVKRQAPVTFCLSDDPTANNPTCSPNAVTDSATRGFIVFVDENGNVDGNGARILTDANDGDAEFDAGETVLMRSVAPGGSIRTSANCGHATFTPTGFTRQAPLLAPALCFPAMRTILLCDDRGRRVAAGSFSAARVVRIDTPGRAQVVQEVAAIATAITTILVPAGVNPTCAP